MALVNAFGELALEETATSSNEIQNAMFETLREILARLPYPDATGQMRVSGTLTANPASGTITNIAQFGALPANTLIYDLMRQSSSVLYDNLVVT